MSSLAAVSVCVPPACSATSTPLPPVSRAVPLIQSILFFLKSISMPPVSPVTSCPCGRAPPACRCRPCRRRYPLRPHSLADCATLSAWACSSSALVGNAAPDEAGAAERLLPLDHRHLQPELRGANRRHVAARPRAHHHHVVFARHARLLPARPVATRTRHAPAAIAHPASLPLSLGIGHPVNRSGDRAPAMAVARTSGPAYQYDTWLADPRVAITLALSDHEVSRLRLPRTPRGAQVEIHDVLGGPEVTISPRPVACPTKAQAASPLSHSDSRRPLRRSDERSIFGLDDQCLVEWFVPEVHAAPPAARTEHRFAPDFASRGGQHLADGADACERDSPRGATTGAPTSSKVAVDTIAHSCTGRREACALANATGRSVYDCDARGVGAFGSTPS